MVRPPYWESRRIAGSAAQSWQAFDGTCSLRGVDASELSWARFCNAFVAWYAQTFTKMEDFEKWYGWLIALPPDVAARVAAVEVESQPAPAAVSRNPSFASFKAGVESIGAG